MPATARPAPCGGRAPAQQRCSRHLPNAGHAYKILSEPLDFGFHIICIVGRKIVRTPLLRDGVKPRVNFTIAVDRQNGVDWIPCVAWGPTATAIAEHTDKGHLVGIEGRLSSGKYVNDAGDTVYTMDVAIARCDLPQVHRRQSRHHRPRRPGQQRRVRGGLNMTATADARSLRGPGLPATPSREERLDAAHTILLDGIRELTTSDAWACMLRTAAMFPQYSFGNIVLILQQRPNATRCGGMRLWNSLGRRVNKGERGIRILAPILRKQVDEITGEDAEKRVCGFTLVSVFDEAQTYGNDVDPTRPHLLHGSAPEGMLEAVCAQIASHGFAVSFGDCGGANGVTNWTTSTVTIRDDIEPLQSAKTALHELAHVTAHRPIDDAPYVCRGVKEVEAESIAFVVAHTLGLDVSSYSFGYVAHWFLEVGELEAVQATAGRVLRHARQILDGLDI